MLITSTVSTSSSAVTYLESTDIQQRTKNYKYHVNGDKRIQIYSNTAKERLQLNWVILRHGRTIKTLRESSQLVVHCQKVTR